MSEIPTYAYLRYIIMLRCSHLTFTVTRKCRKEKKKNHKGSRTTQVVDPVSQEIFEEVVAVVKRQTLTWQQIAECLAITGRKLAVAWRILSKLVSKGYVHAFRPEEQECLGVYAAEPGTGPLCYSWNTGSQVDPELELLF